MLTSLSLAPKRVSVWLLVPAAISLAVFAYLLTLHPTAAGRVYAANGGEYVSVAIVWLWMIDAVHPTPSRFSPHILSPP
jgi:small multidrug resistance family-3 protein